LEVDRRYQEGYDFFSEDQFLKESKMATQQVASGPVPVVPEKPKPQTQKKKHAPVSAQKPGRILPTERINVAKQLDMLRGFAAVSSNGTKAASINEVASVLKVASSSVALASSFLASIGLIVRTDAGTYNPAPEVIGFLRAFEWNKETASHKLGPLFRESWFGRALVPRLLIAPIEEEAAVQTLAETAPASTEYRKELRMLLDFLVVGGVVTREGNMVKLVAREGNSTTETTPATVKPEAVAPELTRGMTRPNPSTVMTAFDERPGSMSFNVSFHVDMAEFSSWQPDRLQAFFQGIAQVLHAKANVEKGGQIS
jgi:hypothetical protein